MDKALLESELKIPVTNFEPVRASLRRERAVLVQVMAREITLLLDQHDGWLRTAGSFLRLRQHGDRNLLTLKGPVSYSGAIKVRAHRAIRELRREYEKLERAT